MGKIYAKCCVIYVKVWQIKSKKIEYIVLGIEMRDFNSNLLVVMENLLDGYYWNKDLYKVQKWVMLLFEERDFQL